MRVEIRRLPAFGEVCDERLKGDCWSGNRQNSGEGSNHLKDDN